MQKKWLYRFILSYIPIFFAVIFCLMLLFFLGVNEWTKKQSLNAYHVYSQQVMHIVDSTLQNIDTLASKNLLLNPKVAAYFENTGEQSPYSYYGVTEVLLDFVAPLPMIDSIYLYRATDGKILMQQFSSDLNEFGDREFIEQAVKSTKPITWSGVRPLSLYQSEERQRTVVSLVKKMPYYSGDQGLIVINIHSGSLQALVKEMYAGAGGGGAACLADASGNSLEGPGRVCGTKTSSSADEGEVTLVSPYTGWRLYMNIQQGSWFSLMSTFSYIWFVLGLIAIAGGIGGMTYISHRHYRPIDQVLSRIVTFTEKKTGRIPQASVKDEFAFIDHALVSLIEQSNQFEEQHAEGIQYRRTMLFKELMEGSRHVTKEELHRESALLGLDAPFNYVVAAIVEMDAFAGFVARYSSRDQLLFKFTLRSAIQEIAEEEGEFLWTEWLSTNRLGLLYRKAGSGGERHMVVKVTELAERARAWVEAYLKFTVTFGIGTTVKDPKDIATSFRQAGKALERKISLGANKVVVYDPQWDSLAEGTGVDTLVQELQETAQLFRLGNPDWKLLMNQAFQAIAAGIYSREDVTGMLRLFKGQLKREMQELPPELQDVWKADGLPNIQELPEDPEWIGETQSLLLELLASVERKLHGLRINREQYSLASRVREYVMEHYASSDLSLSQVSDALNMNQKTLSRTFKEEFGEKFVDYLAKVRVEQAKKQLIETSEPVQVIAEKVGYLYPMSFIRVFKKVEGITPGDYRKEHSLRTDDSSL
ncbi:helix-turn-helix domain-containing protein [Paenibacillus sp. OAS669]|uniref:helix-turn-helix domain-containing protein n=1 Tax=Paenibacillus sp. OAS669 TaxID=2663821 RepID=UPI00178B74DD|nr:helix-turn-helix domain-containing protein [Paenibacillus sp. OAS669]MBE1442887.1 AraC-like DNA-binding protein [Paenibacillus sp. OAS669]